MPRTKRGRSSFPGGESAGVKNVAKRAASPFCFGLPLRHRVARRGRGLWPPLHVSLHHLHRVPWPRRAGGRPTARHAAARPSEGGRIGRCAPHPRPRARSCPRRRDAAAGCQPAFRSRPQKVHRGDRAADHGRRVAGRRRHRPHDDPPHEPDRIRKHASRLVRPSNACREGVAARGRPQAWLRQGGRRSRHLLRADAEVSGVGHRRTRAGGRARHEAAGAEGLARKSHRSGHGPRCREYSLWRPADRPRSCPRPLDPRRRRSGGQSRQLLPGCVVWRHGRLGRRLHRRDRGPPARGHPARRIQAAGRRVLYGAIFDLGPAVGADKSRPRTARHDQTVSGVRLAIHQRREGEVAWLAAREHGPRPHYARIHGVLWRRRLHAHRPRLAAWPADRLLRRPVP